MAWSAFSVTLLVSASLAVAQADELFLEAVYENRTAVALLHLEEGVDATAKNEYGVSALPLACQNGNAQLVTALLKAGADPNVTLTGGETALMTASRTGRPEIVKLLLDAGAKVGAVDHKKQNALMWAAADGHAEVVQLLIASGADPKKTLNSGFDAFFFAARNGKLETVELLLSNGVDGSRLSKKGMTALQLAVENGHFELAVRLLESGMKADDQRSGHTPLHMLTWVRKPNRGDNREGMPPPAGSGELTSLEFARMLVERFDADVNATLKQGSSGGPKLGTRGATPFFLAARTSDLDYLRLLAELGADHSIPNADGVTPFLACVGVGSSAPEEEAGTEVEALAVVNWMLEKGIDINATSRQGETAMHGAAYRNRPKLVKWLHENGADLSVWNTGNKQKRTPLLIAQGFRPGNFKPDFATIVAIESVMRAEGVEPPKAPKRPDIGAPKKYEAP